MKRIIIKGTIKEVVKQLQDDMQLYKGYTIEQYVRLKGREECLKKLLEKYNARS